MQILCFPPTSLIKKEIEMKLKINLRPIVLSIILSSLAIPYAATTTASAQTQDSNVALQRGYRTGYSDGYMSGYRDKIDSVARDYSRHAEYKEANRAFNKDYGTVEEYRDGYQQGFESGYDTGFDRRSFESSLPTELKRRGVVVNDSQTATNTTQSNTTQTTGGPADAIKIGQQSDTSASNEYQAAKSPIIMIPRDTELLLELQDDISTDHNRAGDKFTAKVVSPSEIAGATVEGRIVKISHPGKINRRSEMALSFDRIILNDNRWSNFNAMLVEVMPVKGDNVRTVDTEGTAVGKNSIKSDAIKVGAAAGTGLVVGAVVGGPVGAAVGAGVGAAFGVGAVVIQRGKQIKLNRNQQLRIKTAYETQIR